MQSHQSARYRFSVPQPEPQHLQMIQAVIDRMGRNSFLLKGWSISLVAALLGLAVDKANSDFAVIAAVGATVLALLDGYYLAVERRYRDLYNEAIDQAQTVAEWSLTAKKVKAGDVWSALFSATVLPLHGTAIVCAVVVALSS
jgi:uncharacterized membrane protein